jgi:hypothetical protein
MTLPTHRLKQSESLKDCLTLFAKHTLERASRLGSGIEQDDLIRKVRHDDIVPRMDRWINSPGLQPPK